MFVAMFLELFMIYLILRRLIEGLIYNFFSQQILFFMAYMAMPTAFLAPIFSWIFSL